MRDHEQSIESIQHILHHQRRGGGGEEYDIGCENVTGRTGMGIGGAAAASTTLAAAAAGNATTTSLDSQDSTSCMDGIEWDDESVRERERERY